MPHPVERELEVGVREKEEIFWKRKFPQTHSKKVTGWQLLGTNPAQEINRGLFTNMFNISHPNIFAGKYIQVVAVEKGVF